MRGSDGLEAGWQAEGAHAHDHALAGHQPGHRLHRAQGSGVGQGHRGPGEVVGGDLVGVDLADEVLVGAHEALEVPGVGLRDARDEERAARSASRRRRRGRGRRARGGGRRGCLCRRRRLDEGGVHGGDGQQRLHDGVADQMGEADLSAGGPPQLVVDDGAVDLEQLGRHHPHAGGRGDAQRGLHVGDDAPGRAPQRRGPLDPGRGGRCLRRRRRRRRCGGGRSRGRRRRRGGRWTWTPSPPARCPSDGSRRRIPSTTATPTTDRSGSGRTCPRRARRWARTPPCRRCPVRSDSRPDPRPAPPRLHPGGCPCAFQPTGRPLAPRSVEGPRGAPS